MESIRKRLAALSLAALTVLSVPAVSFADESMGTKGDVKYREAYRRKTNICRF